MCCRGCQFLERKTKPLNTTYVISFHCRGTARKVFSVGLEEWAPRSATLVKESSRIGRPSPVIVSYMNPSVKAIGGALHLIDD